jgi:tRNA threonylcarbamoyladenosine biosynthesis protein TsaB
MTLAVPDPQHHAVPGTPDAAEARVRVARAGAACRILALGTSTEWCSVALLVRTGAALRVDSLSERAGNAHSRRVLPMVQDVLARAGLSMRDLDAIGFDAGPGSFTGIRIGCGVAQGIGFGLERPVAAIASLEAMAWQTRAPVVAVAMDARMGEIYVGAFRCTSTGDQDVAVRPVAVAPIAVLPAVQAAEQLAHWRAAGVLAADDAVVGDAAARHPAFGAQLAALALRSIEDTHAHAGSVACLAEARLKAGERLDAAWAAPLYVRDKVALDVDEQRRLRAARG